MNTLNKLFVSSIVLVFSISAMAAPKSVEFSADAVISMPQTPVKQSKLFVSKQAVRRELSVNGRNMIEIVYPEQGKAVMINDFSRSYEERQFNKADKSADNNPCSQIMHSRCQKLGNETIDGIKTEKWQILSNEKGRVMRTLHWIDVKRKLAIREFFPDGSVAELKLVSKEKINGRNTEKWQRTLSRVDGTVTSSFQWYDTELGIAIREELPGGYLRELKNIKVKKQSDELFSVPGDYVRMNMGSQSPVMHTRMNNR